MNYETLIKSLSIIIDNEEIEKEGLTLVYALNKEDHLNLSVDLYYKTNQEGEFKPEDDFEAEIGGILIKFVKKT